MHIIETRGNADYLNREKTLFLCSKKTPVSLYEFIFRWTDGLSSHDCIACFNTTEMESEVLKALLVARIPTVLFVMNRFTDVNNIQIEYALQENRLLIVVLRRDEPQGRGATPRLRNEYVMSLCRRVVCGYVNRRGSVYSLISGRADVERLIDDDACAIAAEPAVRHERWSVAQDKVLLRMYYADMGIHAIHRKLRRTYAAVCARIASITQPEEYMKGREFEDFVLSLFDLHDGDDLVLQEWQGDKKLGLLSPENNSNPDFVFRYGRRHFAVECKWRERLSKDIGETLFQKRKLDDYMTFSSRRRIPVTIVLGVGGDPGNPESLYVIPLKDVEGILSHSDSIELYRNESMTLSCSMFLRSRRRRDDVVSEQRRHYPNAFRPWDAETDASLLSLYRSGQSIKSLAIHFSRSERAISMRIKKLCETS